MRQGAFTLLELMIVVIVVGVLASFAIPMFKGAIERARWAECINTLGAIKRAMEIYYFEFGRYPHDSYRLNFGGDSYPSAFNLGIPEPNDDGRYLYWVLGTGGDSPSCGRGFHDKNGNGSINAGEGYIDIMYEEYKAQYGSFASGFGAPEF